MNPASPAVGLVGLGLMGSAFADRLRAAGFRLLGYDLAPARCADFATAGGTLASGAQEVFARCDRIVLSLPSHREVGAVVAAIENELRPAHVVIDTTTGDPDHSVSVAEKLRHRGASYLDATVSGNSAQIRAGGGLLMVGGDVPAFESCRDVLQHLGGALVHTGGSGTGAKMKLVTNLVLGLNRAALAEGLALAESVGLAPERALQAMRAGAAYSRIMDAKGEKMLRSEFSPDARLSQHLKDVRLIVELGTHAGLPMTLSTAHRVVLEEAQAAGLGDLDNSALIEVLRGKTAKTNRG